MYACTHRNTPLIVLILATILSTGGPPAKAAPVIWAGPNNTQTDWFSPNAWSPNSPGSNDDVEFDVPGQTAIVGIFNLAAANSLKVTNGFVQIVIHGGFNVGDIIVCAPAGQQAFQVVGSGSFQANNYRLQNGKALVADANTSVSVANDMTIGDSATGTTPQLTVESGGTLSVTGNVQVESGDVFVTGNGSKLNAGGLVIAYDAWTSNVRIADQAQVTLTGNFDQQTGETNLTSGGQLLVAGNGTVDVADDIAPRFNVVDGAASFDGSFSVLSAEANVGAAGTLTASQIQVGVTSRPEDPLLTSNGTVNAPSGVQLNRGRIQGAGTIVGNVTGTAGTIAPGNSPGTLTIDGNYIQTAGITLEIELGGLSPGTLHDLLNVTGSATLDGTLDVNFVPGYTPSVGDKYVVVNSTMLNGTFSSLKVPGGYTFEVDYGNLSSNAVTLSVSAVPEPSSFLFQALVATGWMGWRRMKQNCRSACLG